MFGKFRNFGFFSAYLALFIVLSGVNNCSELKVNEPREYCRKAYQDDKAAQTDCSIFCEKHKDFNTYPRLIEACHYGQMAFLASARDSASETGLACDRNYKDDLEAAKACRVGANEEVARTSKRQKGPGTAGDRETGN